MLRLKALGPNCHEVTDGRVTVLFSYATPVAAHIQGLSYRATSTKHSVTTSRHINAFTGGSMALQVSSCYKYYATNDSDAVMIGRGHAFSNDWAADDTSSEVERWNASLRKWEEI